MEANNSNKVLQINDICKIKPAAGTEMMSLAVGTNRGTVQLFGMDPEKSKIHQTVHAHYG